MTDRNINTKAFNRENKKNDVGRSEYKKGNPKIKTKFKNFDGEPVK